MTAWQRSSSDRRQEGLQPTHTLETNRINQLVVGPTLQTTDDEAIFAIGDCAAAPWVGQRGATVPPRAQAAHQEDSHLVRQLARRVRGQSVPSVALSRLRIAGVVGRVLPARFKLPARQ